MSAIEFLAAMEKTANNLDFEAHMNLVSKDVRVFGMPGFDVINYQGWFDQCQHEFENKVLKSVSYEGLVISEELPDRITFISLETVEGNDGTVNKNSIEFIIQKEDDGQWRVVQETALKYGELM